MKKTRTQHLMRRLVNTINAEKYYPVSYIYNQDRTKFNESTQLLGKDLTENQIFELWETGKLSQLKPTQ